MKCYKCGKEIEMGEIFYSKASHSKYANKTSGYICERCYQTLTYGIEDCALVVMRTNEHVKNFEFTETHEYQFFEGKNALQTAYQDAEVFLVFIFEDLDGDGLPDPSVNGYYEISGGVFGGRTGTAFYDDYWKYAEYYVKQW